MKKPLKLALLTIIISSSILAKAEGDFYLKANVGVNKMNRIIDKDESTDSCMTLRCKSKPAAIYMVGFGYNVGDELRTDLTLEYVANPSLRGYTEAGDIKYYGKHKGNITALFGNVYRDIAEVKDIKLFAGAGLGVARVKETLSGSCASSSGECDGFSVGTKNRNNLTYQFSLGASKALESGVITEILYSWRDYGKTGGLSNEPNVTAKSHYRGHNIIAGFRFKI